MSLIEKAAQKIRRQDDSLIERAAKKEPGVTEAAPTKTVMRADSETSSRRSSREVEIDFELLEHSGFLVPDSPTTVVAEEFRLVKRSILLNAIGKGQSPIDRGNLVLVASSQPGEGKTYCAINLALSIASERDLTVLLVDADFAKPDVLRRLGVKGGKGLVDVILDPEVKLSDCLLKTNIPNLTILPAGRHHNLTTELLASDRMAEIVAEIAARYSDRVVIFDSPPVLASSTGSVMGLHVGQVIFVVEADRTTEEDLKEALSLLSDCKHINLLLNKAEFKGVGRFGSYYGYTYPSERRKE